MFQLFLCHFSLFKNSNANVPSEPLRLIGEISEMYMGTSVVLRPQFNPIMNRPKIRHSKLLKYFEELSKVAPTIANTLLSKRPHFLVVSKRTRRRGREENAKGREKEEAED